MKDLAIVFFLAAISGCATLTEDAMTPIMLSFSDGSSGNCHLENKRGVWEADIPGTVSVRKSDDTLKFRCKTIDGREALGGIPSSMGGKIVASAVFLDFGIVDSITDKHRKYPVSVTLPITKVEDSGSDSTRLLDKPIQVSERKKAQLLDVGEAIDCSQSVSLISKDGSREVWLLNCGDERTVSVDCEGDDCFVRQ